LLQLALSAWRGSEAACANPGQVAAAEGGLGVDADSLAAGGHRIVCAGSAAVTNGQADAVH